jgi:two-component system phosphate regulon sensor histidine kinase PhoR
LQIGETEGRPEAIIAVSDSGAPISPEQKTHLFQRFYRVGTRRRVSGLGLGLYLSREFVQMHQGRIWLENADDQEQGNTFCFSLPLRAPASSDEPL